MTKHYELLFVLKPTLTEEENKEKLEFIKKVLVDNEAKIASVHDMGMRKLAYEIQKYPRGYYYVIYYEAKPSVIDEILRNLRYSEDVIRFLNIKYENKKEIRQWQLMSEGKPLIQPKENKKEESKTTSEKENNESKE